MTVAADDDNKQAAALAAVAKFGSINKASAATGIPRTTLQGIVKRAAIRGDIGGPPIPEIARPPEGFAVYRNGGQYDADGNLLRQYISTKRDTGEVYAVPEGHVVKGESTLVDADGRVAAKWIKTAKGASTLSLMEAMQEAFEKYDGAAPVIEAPTTTDADLLTVYPIPDLHFGMYAWGEETGADYDTSIATQLATKSIGQLIAQSRPSETAVVLVLGDYFHANDHKNVTPGSAHRLDVDGRWPKVLREGCALLCHIVKMVAAKHKRVVLKVLKGNHDDDAAPALSLGAYMFFSGSERIAVDMAPKSTWYFEHGTTLLGAHHGHEIRKFEMMAMAMASDMPEAWGRTEYRHFFSGHIHHESKKEIMGVKVESFSSPAAPDAWNAGSGYRSSRSFTALTYGRSDGEVGRHTVNISKRQSVSV